MRSTPTIPEESENVVPQIPEERREARPWNLKVTWFKPTQCNLALTVPNVAHGKVPQDLRQASFDLVDGKANKPRSEAQRRGRVFEEVSHEQIRCAPHIEGERGLAARPRCYGLQASSYGSGTRAGGEALCFGYCTYTPTLMRRIARPSFNSKDKCEASVGSEEHQTASEYAHHLAHVSTPPQRSTCVLCCGLSSNR